jgi:hypothetical protein
MTGSPDGGPGEPDEPPKLARGWIIAGIVATLLGIAAGFVMSLAALR